MDLRDNMLRYEKTYSSFACLDKDAIRLKKIDEDIRPSYYRDIDRIIYSLAYLRYMDKTQVFSKIDNDHISKRMIHVNFVSKIARTIGRALGLNEDLIEAIALGHDLGHVPFGHVGEHILSDLSLKYDGTYFNHNIQSVRLLKNVENHGLGSNLTVQTLDGIMCHNGEFCLDEYRPRKKTVEEFLNDYEKSYIDKEIIKKQVPMTLEGCVVRLSDIVGYVGRDIEDAIRIGILNINDIPKEITDVLGTTNTEIVNTIIMDVIENSCNKPYIKLSKEVFNALSKLKDFNYRYIYNKANTKEQLEEYKFMFTFLFETYLNQLENKDIKEDIYTMFLNDMDASYLDNTKDTRKVIDYIAGMTDDFFIKQYKKYKK